MAEEGGFAKEALGKAVRPILKRASHMGLHPFPYIACIVADGDRMGHAMKLLRSPEEHRQFSAQLSQFARKARNIIEQECHGLLVYSGGDDVLGFLPIPRALEAADKLQQAFLATMQSALSEGAVPRPTLSVGIGIGHVLEHMGWLLELGREAEKLAKGDHLPEPVRRNALAVIVDKRSGGRTSYRAQWDKEPIARLETDASLFRSHGAGGQRLSRTKLQQMQAAWARFPNPAAAEALDHAASWCRALEQDLARTLARTEGGEANHLSLHNLGWPEAAPTMTYEAVHQRAFEMLERLKVAREIIRADVESLDRKEAVHVAS